MLNDPGDCVSLVVSIKVCKFVCVRVCGANSY